MYDRVNCSIRIHVSEEMLPLSLSNMKMDAVCFSEPLVSIWARQTAAQASRSQSPVTAGRIPNFALNVLLKFSPYRCSNGLCCPVVRYTLTGGNAAGYRQSVFLTQCETFVSSGRYTPGIKHLQLLKSKESVSEFWWKKKKKMGFLVTGAWQPSDVFSAESASEPRPILLWWVMVMAWQLPRRVRKYATFNSRNILNMFTFQYFQHNSINIPWIVRAKFWILDRHKMYHRVTLWLLHATLRERREICSHNIIYVAFRFIVPSNNNSTITKFDTCSWWSFVLADFFLH